MSRTTDGSPEIPPYDKMFWPTLQAIKQLGDSGSKQEIEDRAIELAGYSEAQQSILHGDGPQTEIRYRLAARLFRYPTFARIGGTAEACFA
jgi:hypothetical protein